MLDLATMEFSEQTAVLEGDINTVICNKTTLCQAHDGSIHKLPVINMNALHSKI